MTTQEKIRQDFLENKTLPYNEPMQIGDHIYEVVTDMRRLGDIDGQAVLFIDGEPGRNFSIGKKYIDLENGWTAFLPAYNYS